MVEENSSKNLEKLKKEFEVFKKKYSLPSFYELNKHFDIEEVEVESDFLLRKIRRIISERIGAYSRFVDIILNPSSAPVFFFKVLKRLDKSDKEILAEIYETLGNFEIELLSLDLDYSEEREADFIKKSYEIFNNNVRIKFLEIVKKLNNKSESSHKESNGSYYG